MKKYRILSIIIAFILSFFNVNCNQNLEIFFNKIFNYLDYCLDDNVKEAIKKFYGIYSIPFEHVNPRPDYINAQRNIRCYDYIDTLVKNEFRNYYNLGVSKAWRFRELTDLIYEFYYYHLKEIKIDYVYKLDSLRDSFVKYDSLEKYLALADSIDGNYIPKDIDDAIKVLDDVLGDDCKEKIMNYKNEEEAGTKEYLDLCSTLRNSWRLASSRLHEYFKEQGVSNYERISVLIIKAYYRKLHNQEINLLELINQVLPYEEKEKKKIQEFDKEYSW